jgi:VanZ family protein
MFKLPSVFRHYDKELHFLFYLLFAIFLNLLFAQKKILNHLIIFFLLLFFGIGIEILQELSNSILNERINGRFDIIDEFCNILGLIYASFFWFYYLILKDIFALMIQ